MMLFEYKRKQKQRTEYNSYLRRNNKLLFSLLLFSLFATNWRFILHAGLHLQRTQCTSAADIYKVDIKSIHFFNISNIFVMVEFLKIIIMSGSLSKRWLRYQEHMY